MKRQPLQGPRTAYRLVCAFVLACLAAGSACGRSPAAPTPPAPISCSFAVTAPASPFGPSGGNGTVSVEAPGGCAWSVTAQADWIAILGSAGGSGTGVVGVAVSALPSGAEPRSGLITVAQQAFRLTQNACEFSLTPIGKSFGDEGGTAEVGLDAQDGCSWTVDDTPSWATVEPTTGIGPSRLSVRVAENPTQTTREAVIRVAGTRLPLTQRARMCDFSLAPRTRVFVPAAGQGLVDISAPAGCSWELRSDNEWLGLPDRSTGVGPGTVRFSVTANLGAPVRSGRLRLGDASADVTQNGQDMCAVRLSAVQAFARLAGGTDQFTVTAEAGCLWTATARQPWLRVLEGASGAGAGRVVYQVDPATPMAASDFRMAPVEVRWPGPTAGENMWVRQFPCTAHLVGRQGAIIAQSQTGFRYDAPAAGGVLKMYVLVETYTGCPWTVQPPTDPWVTLRWHVWPDFTTGDGEEEILDSTQPDVDAAHDGCRHRRKAAPHHAGRHVTWTAPRRWLVPLGEPRPL